MAGSLPSRIQLRTVSELTLNAVAISVTVSHSCKISSLLSFKCSPFTRFNFETDELKGLFQDLVECQGSTTLGSTKANQST